MSISQNASGATKNCSRLHAETVAALAQLEQRGRKMQILKNLGDTLQACNSREEAYPFIALAATELFPGARGALAVPAAAARELFETVTEWGGRIPSESSRMDEAGFRHRRLLGAPPRQHTRTRAWERYASIS